MKSKKVRRFTALYAVALLSAAVYGAEWISVPSAPVHTGPVGDHTRAADGTSWFARTFIRLFI